MGAGEYNKTGRSGVGTRSDAGFDRAELKDIVTRVMGRVITQRPSVAEPENEAGAGIPHYLFPIHNDRYIEKLCFTTCLNHGFLPGAVALIRSIRKFYSPDEADIVAFIDTPSMPFNSFCSANNVEIRYFDEIEDWALPLIYDDPDYANDDKHYYHVDFKPLPEIPENADRVPGFDTIRHLHPLNVKAYCTAYCLLVKNYRRVAHIDSDAFLLSRIDTMFDRHGRPGTVIAFDDGDEALLNLELLYSIRKPHNFSVELYGFNAGVVLYVNDAGVKRLMRDFMFYIESCYHFENSAHFADQGVLRALVAKHHILGHIRYVRESAVNWNPTDFRAEDLHFDPDTGEWINLANGQKQFIFHAAGGERIWSGRYVSPSVNEAWRWIGGSNGFDWTKEFRRAAELTPTSVEPIDSGRFVDKLCFTTSVDKDSVLGAMGLIRSVRKFYGTEEADIVVFVDRDVEGFAEFCAAHSTDVCFNYEIDDWLQPLIYDDPKYAEDNKHFYHPKFEPYSHLPFHSPSIPGFGAVRHLHRRNVKAYCTGYCLCVKRYRRVVFMDPDAFLLHRIDGLFEKKRSDSDCVIAFHGAASVGLTHIETLFSFDKPDGFELEKYGFDAGVVCYVNGPGTQQLARDFMFYIESCYHWDFADGDQGLLHALVAKHSALGNIQYDELESLNWNPAPGMADDLEFISDTGVWINNGNGDVQRIWRSGGEPNENSVWTGRYASPAVNEAWRWAGGGYEGWMSVPGTVSIEDCKAAASAVIESLPKSFGPALNILMLGTQYGRVPLALAELLRMAGYDVHVDATGAFGREGDSAANGVNRCMIQDHVNRLKAEGSITLHAVTEIDVIGDYVGGDRFGVVYIEAAGGHRNVLGRIVTALLNAKPPALIIGNGACRSYVMSALDDAFEPAAIHRRGDLWYVQVGL